MGFYCNPSFPLQVHIIKYLFFELTLAYGPGEFQQPVRQRTFSVVNMSYYAKISNIFHGNKNAKILDTFLSVNIEI